MSLPILIFLLPIFSSFICLLCIIFNNNKVAEYVSSLLLSIASILSIFCYTKISTYTGVYNLYTWLNIGETEPTTPNNKIKDPEINELFINFLISRYSVDSFTKNIKPFSNK